MNSDENQTYVWYEIDHLPTPAILVQQESDTQSFSIKPLELNSQNEFTYKNAGVIELSKSDYENLQKCHPSIISQSYPNFESLPEFTRSSITFQLNRRYLKDDIYTYIGQILIAINPYKLLPTYTNKFIEAYADEQKQKLPPHIFELASWAYRDLKLNHTNQAILVSGESGAGKTETTKLAMQFLSEAAGGASGLEQRLLRSNTILEAFGNAKTQRNDNSSRFGKWLEIEFDLDEGGIMVSAKVEEYLLEKIRVVFQSKGEQNYHCFYYLIAGLPRYCAAAEADNVEVTRRKAFAESLKLTAPENFRILGMVPGGRADWVANFEELVSELKRAGFEQSELEDIFRILAAILHIGNVEFVAEKEEARIKELEPVEIVTEILDLGKRKDSGQTKDLQSFLEFGLEQNLTKRIVKVGQNISLLPMTLEAAKNARDTLAKNMYSELFSWIVMRINTNLKGKNLEEKNKRATIGVLDIFGFEVFEKNSFEQLCINYANESLQQVFNRYIFKENERIYKEEGLNVETVEFKDNEVILKEINLLFRALDDESKMPKGKDSNFAAGLKQKYGTRSGKIETASCIHMDIKHPTHFFVKHYASDVEYSSMGFVDKNRDKLVLSMEALLSTSGHSKILRDIFSGKEDAKGSFLSLSKQFRASLTSLIKKLSAMSIFYVKCIKPNTKKAVHSFDAFSVGEQLKNNGIFETIKARKVGFGFNKLFDEFTNRYFVLNIPKEDYLTAGDSLQALSEEYFAGKTSEKEKCSFLLKELKQKHENFDKNIQIGKTKVFYRFNVMKTLENIYEKLWLEKRKEEKRLKEERLAKERAEREAKEKAERERLEKLQEEQRAREEAERKAKVKESVKEKPQEKPKTEAKPTKKEIFNEDLLQPFPGKTEKIYEVPREFDDFLKILKTSQKKLADYSKLRTCEDYAKTGLFFSDENLKSNMLLHTSEIIPKSLTLFDFSNNQEAERFNADAVTTFKNVLGVMKDRAANYPATLAQEILEFGVRKYEEQELMKEEVFVQLLKQTEKNPDENSQLIGWKLIYLCLRKFTPSEELGLILGSRAADVAGERSPGFRNTQEVAALCLKQFWEKHSKKSAGNVKLSEISDLVEVKTVPLSIVSLDGRSMTVHVAENDRMTLEGFVAEICTRLYLSKDHFRKFALKILFNVPDPKMEALAEAVDPRVSILDYLNAFDQLIGEYNKKNALQIGENRLAKAKIALILEKRYYTLEDKKPEIQDARYVRLSYFAAFTTVRKGELMRLDEQTLASLAAVQLLVMNKGKPLEDENLVDEKVLRVLFPSYLLELKNHEELRRTTWVKANSIELIDKSPKSFHLEYLNITRRKISYGLNLFEGIELEAPKELLVVQEDKKFFLAFNWSVLYVLGKGMERLMSTKTREVENLELWDDKKMVGFEIKGLGVEIKLKEWEYRVAFKLLHSMIVYARENKKNTNV